jgi:TRAP-type C4-dicarboxylate transport system permease small subunit
VKAWARLMQACGGAAAAILGAVVLAVCWDVFARNLGAKSTRCRSRPSSPRPG